MMWHLFADEKPWFAEKRFGYGAGLPIAWQGWALILSYLAAVIGLGVLAEQARGLALAGIVALILLLSVILVVIAQARTRRGWRWRWGDDD
jgi:membrane protein YdbS with pleckstrin-like domain